MSNQIYTLEELRNYGSFNEFNDDFINKTDAPVLTSTTGVYNAIFGKLVWNQINQEANLFGALPKVPWSKSGWRLITARAGSSADGGVAEGGAIPDTIKPTFAEVTNVLKEVSHSFAVSARQLAQVKSDDAIGELEMMRQVMGAKHKEAINQQLFTDVSAAAAGAGADYAGRDGFETIDRVISSDSEEDAFGGSFNAYFDIFGLDRDSATTYDSYVDHASGVDRAITDEMIRTARSSILTNGGKTTFIITGHDTAREIIGLYADQVRYSVIGESAVSVGVNGIQTDNGFDVGMKICSVYGTPMLESKDTPQDTISRIYFIDASDPEGFGTPRFGLMIARPTQYFETGLEQGNPFAINSFNTEGVYYTSGEVYCTQLKAQGKIRDLA